MFDKSLEYGKIKLSLNEDKQYPEELQQMLISDKYNDIVYYDFSDDTYVRNLVFNIIKIDSDENIGIIALYNIDLKNKTAGMESLILDQDENIGLLKQSILCLLNVAFVNLELRKIYAQIIDKNDYTRELYHGIFFAAHLLHIDHCIKNDKKYNVVTSHLFRHEWERNVTHIYSNI